MRIATLPLAGGILLLAAAAASGAGRAAPVNESPPTITGSALVGKTLTAAPGTWSGTGNRYGYEWRRCDSGGGSCAAITGATGAKYTVVSADLGARLRVAVTARNDGGTSEPASSDPTQVVTTSGGKPANTKPPTVAGTAVVGAVLTAAPGAWVGDEPIAYAYAWQRCDDAGNVCAAISGAQKSTYKVAKGLVGKTIRVKVTAANSRGSGSAISAHTQPVQDAGGVEGIVALPGGGKSIDVKDVPNGERLIVDKVVFSPNPVRTRSEPITVTVTVKDTRGYFVRNALVFVRSTPVVTKPVEDAPTATDGRLVATLLPEADFPLKNGYSVQFYVKAYRHGDPTLAGVSGTRLVQVATAAG